MTVATPLAVLLVGITGSGKTTLAKALAARGMVRLSVDEEVHRLHGRYGVDYPEHEYFAAELLRCLDERNRREDANALTVTASALDDFFARFEPPADDEGATVYTGEPDTVR